MFALIKQDKQILVPEAKSAEQAIWLAVQMGAIFRNDESGWKTQRLDDRKMLMARAHLDLLCESGNNAESVEIY
jgi:hypothetical protein